MPEQSKSAADLLAPRGVLRAAINYGNAVLAQYDASSGTVSGVTPDLARELAAQLGVKLTLLPYDGAGKIVDAAPRDDWDIAFLAIDPQRASAITYTAPYVQIEGAFCVQADSAFTDPASLDRPGVRIAVGEGAAYELYLRRTLKAAEIVRYPTSDDVFPGMVADGLEAGAGIRQAVEAGCRGRPSLRVMALPFMEIHQAMAVPRAKAAAIPWLDERLVALRRAGFIAASLTRAGQDPAVAILAG